MAKIKREIWIITTKFPYSCFGENGFLVPEIKALQDCVENSDILLKLVPLSRETQEVHECINQSLCVVDTQCVIGRIGLLSALQCCIQSFLSGRLFICVMESVVQRKNLLSAVKWEVYVWKIYGCLKRMIKETGHGDVHIYSYWFLPSAAAAGILKKNGMIKKAITRSHGYDLYEERGFHPCRISDLKNLDGVFSVSKAGEDYLKKKFPSCRGKIKYAYLGVDGGALNLKPTPDDLIIKIYSCSSIIPIKRVPLICAAISYLSKKLPQKIIVWTHFGDGPRKEEVVGLISDLPDNMKVELRGQVESSVVMSEYASGGHVFVNASTTEGLPVSIMEALSYSIPVVATNVGGNAEAVNPLCGRLVPADADAVSLGGAILSILGNNDSYMNMRKAAWESWDVNFNIQNNVRGWLREVL